MNTNITMTHNLMVSSVSFLTSW